ncbi:MAG: ASKHA domain-containing protein [Thermoguttaceae bacterium]|jgi:uncharacterized 2Fe-2S/4Fe-4S cluster protein (DUF4445 family)|nr:ASKHA domain-containing protein [Thermoguttaceae bacterium]
MTNESSNKLPIPPGALVAEVLRASGYALDLACGGVGVCGKCLVDVYSTSGTRRAVLACRTYGSADAAWVDVARLARSAPKIYVPESPLELSAAPTDAERRGTFGLAVDLGTTTIVCTLASLSSGRVFGVQSTRNPQTAYGRDVLSRIAAARAPETAAALRQVVCETIERLGLDLLRDAGVSAKKLVSVIIAGNTTMEFLLTGRDAAPLGEAPFCVDVKTFPEYRAAAFGWTSFPNAPVLVFPVFSAFVGGDVLAGVEHLRLKGVFEQDKKALLFDVGTNGETFLGVDGSFYTSSTAAGPAFEGGRISQGSLAVPGAIASVEHDVSQGLWNARTLGGAPSKSVCGSGLIDALAAALEFGLLAPDGRIRESSDEAARSRGKCKERKLLISNDEEFPVWLTQQDVREAQLALGAMKAGLRLTLEAAGIAASELDAFFLSGGFGGSLNCANARRVGAIPSSTPIDRVYYGGNTSLFGALDALLERFRWNSLEETIFSVEPVDLVSRADFAEIFAQLTRFPEQK